MSLVVNRRNIKRTIKLITDVQSKNFSVDVQNLAFVDFRLIDFISITFDLDFIERPTRCKTLQHLFDLKFDIKRE